MNIEIIEVDYRNSQHADHLRHLLDGYARDPMGGGEAIPPEILHPLPARLAEFPTAFSVLAYADGDPAGLINCFFGFSTFAGRPLVNIHDVVVDGTFRGKGISRRMFDRVEQIARDKDCCKITLEVVDGNETAMQIYRRLGFYPYQLSDDLGAAQFWHKKL